MWDWLKDIINDFAEWLLDVILWVPKKVFELLLDALAAIIEAIPVPDWLSGAGGLFSSIPASVMYFAEPMHLGTGVGIITSAYVIRFFIRRIPVIG